MNTPQLLDSSIFLSSYVISCILFDPVLVLPCRSSNSIPVSFRVLGFDIIIALVIWLGIVLLPTKSTQGAIWVDPKISLAEPSS